MTGPGQEVRRYRVEHWGSDCARVLAIVADVFPHRTTLVPYASRLLMEGVTGKVVLLDDANDAVLATYNLAAGMQRIKYTVQPRRPKSEGSRGSPVTDRQSQLRAY